MLGSSAEIDIIPFGTRSYQNPYLHVCRPFTLLPMPVHASMPVLRMTLLMLGARALADAGGAAGAGCGVRGPGAARAAAQVVLASRPGRRGGCQRRGGRGRSVGCTPVVMHSFKHTCVTRLGWEAPALPCKRCAPAGLAAMAGSTTGADGAEASGAHLLCTGDGAACGCCAQPPAL